MGTLETPTLPCSLFRLKQRVTISYKLQDGNGEPAWIW